ncbi:calphotin-like isoform X3 [Channa argus]|uniref:calphotin-like isoform X3 n=1 Tax=Channa argus TaxID=215402 RepID=UPI003522E452
MPSKRKKNKRRMRRVQAQRRALEEQHATHPPVKASPGIAVSTPPAAAPKKVLKTPAPAPAKFPEAVPIAAPTVESKPVVKESVAEPVPVKALELEPVLLEPTPAEAEAQVPALVTEEAPVIEMTPVAPSVAEAAVVQEVEAIIPVTEMKPTAEAPLVAPAETEVQTVDSTITATETEQHVPMLQVCKAETGVEAEASAEEDRFPEVEVEVSVPEDTSVLQVTTEATEEPVVEVPNTDHVSAEAEPAADMADTERVVESVVTEIPEPDVVTEAVVSAAAPADDKKHETEVDVLADVSEASTEPVTIAKDVPAQSVEIPAVADTVAETPVEKTETLLTEVKETHAIQDVVDTPDDDFVDTESISAANVATVEPVVVHLQHQNYPFRNFLLYNC